MLSSIYYSARRAILLAICAAYLTAAPFSGAIVGLITNRSDSAVGKVRVVLVDVTSGARHETITDDEGFFSFSLLPPGEYRLEPVGGHFLPPGGARLVLNSGEKRSCRLVWDREPDR
jgi:hypothetical protein